MTVAAHARPRVKLSVGAQIADVTPHGFLKILKRTKNAIRDDGRWYAYEDIVEQIAAAQARFSASTESKE